MTLKFLALLAFLVGLYWLGRRHFRRLPGRPPPAASPPRVTSRWHQLLVGLGIAILISPAWIFYRDWAAGEQILQIRVINPNGAPPLEYRAKRKQVRLRSFVTLDGSWITLTDLERLEAREQ